jgi:hypothetical protein
MESSTDLSWVLIGLQNLDTVAIGGSFSEFAPLSLFLLRVLIGRQNSDTVAVGGSFPEFALFPTQDLPRIPYFRTRILSPLVTASLSLLLSHCSFCRY